jgi:hypothetical protein
MQSARLCRLALPRTVQVEFFLSFLVALFAQNPPLGAQKVAFGHTIPSKCGLDTEILRR